MQAMKSNSLEKFLQGKADENETRQSEQLLADRQTVANDQLHATTDDSLIAALRTDTPTSKDDAAAIRQMTERLERMIPRPEISAEEIRELLDPVSSPDALGRIGKYEITEYLASGGMGLVFRATDPQLQREVCVKLLNPIRARSVEARTRFDRETRAIARLNCQRIMPILDLGTHRELPWLVMPLLDGVSLRTLLLREGTIALPRALHIATQIAEGLDTAHQMNVLHRDIKPDNLWITPTDDVKLLDFGLARTSDETAPITHEGTVVGTPSYMSPEQITGKSVDRRSDLFSLGVVLVEMLTGQSPFRKDNLFSTLMSVAADEIRFEQLDPDFKIPGQVRDLIRTLLQKNPEQRPASAAAVIATLCDLKDSCHTSNASSQKIAQKTSSKGRRTWVTSLAAACGGFFMCLAALGLWQLNDKGTLVVETSDPQVEVHVVGERASVRDPLTNRTYEIRIGPTPLPSGVYQLELTDKASDLVFSSQTIAIRRGEQTIVSVQLKPPRDSQVGQSSTSLPSDPSAQAATTAPVSFVPPLEPVARDQIADASYDPDVRERFSKILAGLPALPLSDHFPADRLGQSVNVPRPERLAGIDAWSLEIPATKSPRAEWQTNFDQTLFATENEHVWIFDGYGKPRYMLPVSGTLIRFKFDERHPNLIAVCSWEGEPKIGVYEPREARRYRIHVWRLAAEGAELIRSFASSSYHMAWDQGYRMIHFWEGNIVASRIDTGDNIVLTKQLNDVHSELSLSPGGRFLVTRRYTETPSTNIVDLHRGQFVSSILLIGHLQWRDDEAALAVFAPNNPNNFFAEIWRPDRPELLKRVELIQPERIPENLRNAELRSRPALDREFSRIAFTTREGDLRVRSLSSQREASVQMEGLRQLKKMALVWNADGTLSIRGEGAAYLWRPSESEVHGVLSLDTLPNKPPERVATLFSQPPFAVRDGRLFFQDSSATKGNGLVANSSIAYTGDFNISTEISPRIRLKSLETVETPSISPNGKKVLRVNLQDSEWKELELLSLDHDALVKLATPTTPSIRNVLIREPLSRSAFQDQSWRNSNNQNLLASMSVIWSTDDLFVLIHRNSGRYSSRGDTRYSPLFMVRNTQTGDGVDFGQKFASELVHFNENVPLKIVPCRDGFIGQALSSSKRTLFLLQPATGQVSEVERSDEQTGQWVLQQSSGDYIFFSGPIENESQTFWARTRLVDGKLTETVMIRLPQQDRLIPAPDGEHYCRISYDPKSIKILPSDRGNSTQMQISDLDKFPISTTVNRWDTATEVPIVSWKTRNQRQKITWHRNGKHLVVQDGYANQLFVLDLAIQSWKNHLMIDDENTSIFPVESGWLLVVADRLKLLDHAGQLQSTWQLGVVKPRDQNEADPLATGTWISADGAIPTDLQSDSLQVVYRRDQRVCLENLKAFQGSSGHPSLPVLRPDFIPE